MSDGVSVEIDGLDGWISDLHAAPTKAVIGVRAVVQKGALNVKKGMQQDFSGIAHAPSFPASITYETKVSLSGVEAEIGPDKNRRQGALGNILAFGTSKNGPVADITASMRAEEPNLVKFLGEVGEQALGG